MASFDLRKEAILGKVYVGQVGLSARSKTLTNDAIEKHQVDSKSVAGIVYKIEADSRKEITQAMNQARGLMEAKTLPWGKTGMRLIPIAGYPNLKMELEKLSNKFFDAVEGLLDNYDHLRTDYLRRVNDLAWEVPFPTKDQIRTGFHFQFIEMPIPNMDDIRFHHVSEETIVEIQTTAAQQMKEALEKAQTEIVTRLIELVEHVKEQCDKDPKETRFHKTLIGNIEDAVEVLPSLNITNDPAISKLIAKVRENLTGIDVEDLKANQSYRESTVKVASSVLKDLRKYGK